MRTTRERPHHKYDFRQLGNLNIGALEDNAHSIGFARSVLFGRSLVTFIPAFRPLRFKFTAPRLIPDHYKLLNRCSANMVKPYSRQSWPEAEAICEASTCRARTSRHNCCIRCSIPGKLYESSPSSPISRHVHMYGCLMTIEGRVDLE